MHIGTVTMTVEMFRNFIPSSPPFHLKIRVEIEQRRSLFFVYEQSWKNKQK